MLHILVHLKTQLPTHRKHLIRSLVQNHHTGGPQGPRTNVLAIQPGRVDRANEELRTVRARSSVRHGKDALSNVRKVEVFIFKLGAVDGLPAGSVVVCVRACALGYLAG
jgi:hypothetical protein